MMGTARRRGGVMLLALLLIAAPGVVAEIQATPAPPDAPPSLDRLLLSVDRATPPTARVLVAGTPPSLVFYRATALLYPRRVYSAFPTDYAHAWTLPPTSWSGLVRRAQHDGAGYILVWSLPAGVRVPRAARARGDGGSLLTVMP